MEEGPGADGSSLAEPALARACAGEAEVVDDLLALEIER